MSEPVTPQVRAVHTACTVPGHLPPYDTVHAKVFYPAAPTGDMAERMTGVVAADAGRAPYPVVVVAPGINVTPDSYRWLAEELVGRGYVVVTYSFVTEVFGTGVAVSPGIDVEVLKPETWGSAPCGTALGPLLEAVAKLGAPLQGLLDLDRVGLVGHSAGGSVVLQSAAPEWFPQVRAVATYGTHGLLSTVLGWEQGHVMPLPAGPAYLLLTGEVDGVMAASAVRYGEDGQADRQDPVARTFDVAVERGTTPAHHVVVRGANHFSVVHPHDTTSARSFLDEPATGDPEVVRGAIAAALGLFLDAHLREDAAAAAQLRGWDTAPPPAVLSARSSER